MIAFLTCLEVPAFGGDTMWASTTAAYEALSPGMQQLAQKLRTYNLYDKAKKHQWDAAAGVAQFALVSAGEQRRRQELGIERRRDGGFGGCGHDMVG